MLQETTVSLVRGEGREGGEGGGEREERRERGEGKRGDRERGERREGGMGSQSMFTVYVTSRIVQSDHYIKKEEEKE